MHARLGFQNLVIASILLMVAGLSCSKKVEVQQNDEDELVEELISDKKGK